MQGPEQPRLLFLGAGAVVRDLYAPALTALGWLDSAIVVEPGHAAADAIIAGFPGARIVRVDWDEGLRGFASECDAVVVCLPTHLHEPAVRAALAAGKPVLCEKPLTLDVAAGRALCELANAAGLELAVCLPRRFLPSVCAARMWVEGGLLGAVRKIELEDGGPYQWSPASGAPFRRDSGGVLADMGPHYLDLARMFVGAMTPVRYSDDAAGGVEADCELALRARDCDVVLRLSRTNTLADRILVTCEKGAVEIERGSPSRCRVHTDERIATESEPRLAFSSGPWEASIPACFAEVLQSFWKTARARDCDSRSARDHLDDVAAIAWAYSNRPQRGPSVAHAPALGKVVVTGGSGFIGTHLVERLHSTGAQPIVVPVRRFGSAAEVSRWPVELAQWDWDDPRSFAKDLQGADTVFHLALGNTPGNRSVTVEGTMDLLDAAREANVRRFVILSTMWVYGFPGASRPVDETFPYAPFGGEYAEAKALMERRVRAYCEAHARPEVVILNPTCVFGPRGGVYTRTPLELAREGRFRWIDDGRGTANYVYVGNLVDAMMLAARTPGIHGERFLINDGTATWRHFLSPFLGSLADAVPSVGARELAESSGAKASTISEIASHMLRDADLRGLVMRHPVLKAVAGASKRMVPHLAARPARPQLSISSRPSASHAAPDWLATVFGPFSDSFSSERAGSKLGWRPALDLASSQAATVQWLRDAMGLE